MEVQPSRMDCSLSTTFDTKTQLTRGKKVDMSSLTLFPTTLAANQHRVQPTAIGLMPPSFWRGIKLAPKQKGSTKDGVLPSRINLINEVSADRRAQPPPLADEHIKTFRWRGLKPSAPPTDPLGKERICSNYYDDYCNLNKIHLHVILQTYLPRTYYKISTLLINCRVL